MNEKEMLLNWLSQEFNLTVKVLKNYPNDKLSLKPVEVSRSARDLAAILGEEESAIGQMLQGVENWWQTRAQVTGQTIEEIIEQNIKIHEEVLGIISKTSEEDLHKTFKMGPMTMRRIDAVWMLAKDAIHHRGQFTVYLRLAGAKVPSIYGPSADDDGGMK